MQSPLAPPLYPIQQIEHSMIRLMVFFGSERQSSVCCNPYRKRISFFLLVSTTTSCIINHNEISVHQRVFSGACTQYTSELTSDCTWVEAGKAWAPRISQSLTNADWTELRVVVLFSADVDSTSLRDFRPVDCATRTQPLLCVVSSLSFLTLSHPANGLLFQR